MKVTSCRTGRCPTPPHQRSVSDVPVLVGAQGQQQLQQAHQAVHVQRLRGHAQRLSGSLTHHRDDLGGGEETGGGIVHVSGVVS